LDNAALAVDNAEKNVILKQNILRSKQEEGSEKTRLTLFVNMDKKDFKKLTTAVVKQAKKELENAEKTLVNARKEFNKLQAEYNSMINNTDKAVIDKISKQVENEKKNNKVKKT
jgi:predicted transcriptional regulator